VAKLLHDGAERIFVPTFTRVAANDLKGEVAALAVDASEKVDASTLHSFCFSLLSKMDVMELTGRVPRPMLEFEQRFLLEDLKSFGGIRKMPGTVGSIRRGVGTAPIGGTWLAQRSDR
jgi:superfamily I DNA/RNA helicase